MRVVFGMARNMNGCLPSRGPNAEKTQPFDPDGLASASQEAVERWEQDQYRLQVYNYESDVMVKGVDGALRLPSPSEREALMGFDRGYLSKAISPKLSHDEAFDLVGRMVGNSFHVHVVVVLLHSLLVNFGVATDRDLVNLRASQGDASAGWLLHPRFVTRNVETHDTAKLVLHFMRQAERGGTDVRLDVGIPFRIQAWPRSGINSSLFHWSVIHGYPWKHAAHINVLELQAVTNSVKWRLRKFHGRPCRALHLIDNQVVCSIVTKGRSSSFRMRRSLAQLNAHLLASGLVLIIGYVSTDCNPSDIPSRWAGHRAFTAKKPSGSKLGQS